MVKIFLEGEIIENAGDVSWEVLKRTKIPSGKHLYLIKCLSCGKEISVAGITLEKKMLYCTNCTKTDYSKEAYCRKCKRKLPRSAFRERIYCAGGINHTCKECELKFCKDPEYLANWEKNTKICKKCGETKTIADFLKYPSSADGLTYWCKECIRERNREIENRKRDERRLAKGLPPWEPRKILTFEEMYERELQKMKDHYRELEERKKQRDLDRIEYNKAREEFYSNPSNSTKKFLFSKWKRGEYNYFK